uniref:TLC domain-containing protein n=1 Tax=Alexandrium monilatum TaxID=311494 RepID=A0A6T0Y657_9DINO|mmetsp:Transcript_56960/g.178859  ORF Transcript_56960/g.178859 Transcript_56960/m.178859 type:complete len:169 (-) Transcript_56960:158-664(-)
MAPSSALPLQVLTHGAVWCAGLAGVNLGLLLLARRRPSSWLAQRTSGGAFEAPKKNYVVPIIGQCLVMPPLWVLAWALREPGEPWWLAAQADWPSGEFLAYAAGYFLQDAAVHWSDNGALVALHHLGAILASVAASLTSGWLGLLLTLSMVYELGSLALEPVDEGCAP